ncbi:hypothetical protein EDM80_03490 [bacterium]|nr:MAG: hypothetical protein EDM80_03490 [bacterium]RIK64117.1 MAG: hypothetical protein DCC64_05240 [Planctomycetota bacterium]
MNAAEISSRLASYQSGMFGASVAPRQPVESSRLFAVDLRLPEGDEWQAEDILKLAAERGMDYRALYRRASSRDAGALGELLRLRCDATAAEGHAWFVHELLDLVGDGFFADTLSRESAADCAWVGGLLLFNMGFDHGYEAEVLAAFSRRYPRTYLATVAA